MGSKLGVQKIAATRIGVTLSEYYQRLNTGQKWCTYCKEWHPKKDFCVDNSRGDRLSAKCWRQVAITNGRPRKRDRAAMAKDELAWCRDCGIWLPIAKVRKGRCQPCTNADYRKRYANSERFRNARKANRDRHRRGVERVPPEARNILLETFNGECAYCGKPADTWDHIVPVIHGGQTTPGNIVPACNSCNSSKKTEEVIAWLDKKGLAGHPALADRMALAEAGLYG